VPGALGQTLLIGYVCDMVVLKIRQTAYQSNFFLAKSLYIKHIFLKEMWGW